MVGLFGSHSVEAERSAVRVQRTQRGELLHLLQQAVASASLEFSFDQQAREKEDVQQAHFSRQFVGALQEAREEAERSARAYSEQELRAQRRASERERLTHALNSTLQRVSPQRYAAAIESQRVSSVPAVSSALEEVAIRSSMKRLFGEEVDGPKQTYKNSGSFIKKLSTRLFGSRRKDFISQLKEVHNARSDTRDSFN